MLPVKPVFHSLLTMYWHLFALTLLELLLELLLDESEDVDTELGAELDELFILDDDGTLLLILELDDAPPTIPYGAGCAEHVLAATQL